MQTNEKRATVESMRVIDSFRESEQHCTTVWTNCDRPKKAGIYIVFAFGLSFAFVTFSWMGWF